MNSLGRFLTTHVGSLPREDDLIELMFAKEEGLPLDPAAVDARIQEAVRLVVAKQVEAGIDVVGACCGSSPAHIAAISAAIA